MTCQVRSLYGYPLRPYEFEVRRYDSDGHLLERRAMLTETIPYAVETHTWVDGLEVHRFLNDVDTPWSEEREWTYDSQRRLQQVRVVEQAMQERPETKVYRYTYSPEGRLARIDGTIGDQPTSWTVYQYDEAGRLQSLHSEPGCDRDIARCENYTYFPNGRIHTVERYSGGFWALAETYNEQGRQVASTESGYDLMIKTTRSYDAAGRVTRLWEEGGMNTESHKMITTSVYDSEGRLVLERTGKDQVIQTLTGEPAQYSYTRVTHRLTYICGTQIVWLDEWDTNEDGVPDASRTHERDATGRLIHERYSGTPRVDDGPLQQDFLYDCP